MEPPIITTGKLRKPKGGKPLLSVRIPHDLHKAILGASKESGIVPAAIGRRAMILGARKAIREALDTRGEK